MRPRETDGLRYMRCPNKQHRRYRTVAQQQRTDGSWHCTACGLSHVPQSAPAGRRVALFAEL